MRRQPHSWKNILTKLGFIRKPKRTRALKELNRRLRYEQCEDRCMLTTFTVNVDYDASAPFNLTDNIVTLREAIFRANQLPDHDSIVFAPSLNGATITLGKDANGNNLNLGFQGQLNITESVTIKGEDLSGNPLDITIDASGNDNDVNVDNGSGSRVFSVFSYGYGSNLDVTLKNLTITGGDVASGKNCAILALAA